MNHTIQNWTQIQIEVNLEGGTYTFQVLFTKHIPIVYKRYSQVVLHTANNLISSLTDI